MTLNFASPARVVTRYISSDGIEHKHGFYVNPDPLSFGQWAGLGNTLDLYTIVTKSGTYKTVEDAVNEFWHGQGGILAPDGFRTMFSTTTDFISIELQKFDPQSNTPIWVTEVPFTYSGTSIIAMTPNSQHTWVGKSTEGGVWKSVFLDVGSGNVSTFVAKGGFNANQNQMAWALTNPNSCIIARDGGYIASLRGFWGGQNESVFKKRHRI